MNKWKLNNKGMTMVEIMTALVIVTILMSVLGYIFLSSMNYMTYFGGKRNMKLMLDTMMQQVQDNIIKSQQYGRLFSKL